MIQRRTALLTAVSALAAAALPASVLAQMRNGMTRIVVGFPPGGTADVLARAIAQRLNSDSTPYIVENKAGAGGRLAVTETKNAPADGHTLLMTADPILVIYPHVFKNIAYNTLTDLVPVVPVCSEPCGLVIGPMVPAEVKTLADFIAWCKKNPKNASYATAAAGTTMHFLGSLLARGAGFEFTHIPHRGGAAAVQDVMGGQIASTMTSMGQALPFMSSGKLRVLAVSSEARTARLPDVPTFAELGYKDVTALVYYGIYVRTGVPGATVQELAHTISAAARSPDMVATLQRLELDPFTLTPEQFAQRVKADHARWGPIIKSTGYTIED